MRRIIIFIILSVFLVNSLAPYACAQGVSLLPKPGSPVELSPAFQPPLLQGIKIHRNDPFSFDFILDKGVDAALTPLMEGSQDPSGRDSEDVERLIKYFFAALTIPEKDLWVNLSPYEKDRIVPEAFGQTEMGRDLLAQDYILKQITASLIYPENETGKAFWSKIYQTAFEKYGTTDVPVDTFNKVWIVPGKARIFEGKDSAYVIESGLKVMLETDYQMSVGADPASVRKGMSDRYRAETSSAPANDLTRSILREVVIPVLEKEVNEGANFARLRQVYYSLILATWYKRRVKESILSSAYVDHGKIAGVDIEDKDEKEKIWSRYVEAFRQGVFDLVQDERDPYTKDIVERKYFSGGMGFAGNISRVVTVTTDTADLPSDMSSDKAQIVEVRADLSQESAYGQVNSPFSLLNDPLWLGGLKAAVEKEFNRGRELRALSPVRQDAFSSFGKNWEGLEAQLKDVPADEYVYVPFVRKTWTGAVIYEFFIAKAGTARREINKWQRFAGLGLPDDQGILFVLRTVVDSRTRNGRVLLDVLSLFPSLQGRHFMSDVFSRFVGSLSRDFPGMPVEAEMHTPRTQVLFERYFNGGKQEYTYSIKEMALDLLAGMTGYFPVERTRGVIPADFYVSDDKDSAQAAPSFLFKTSDGIDDTELKWFARFKIGDPVAVEYYAILLAKQIKESLRLDLQKNLQEYRIADRHVLGLRTPVSYLTKKVAQILGLKVVDLDASVAPHKAMIAYSKVDSIAGRADLVDGTTRLRFRDSVEGKKVIFLDDTFVTGTMAKEITRAISAGNPASIHSFFMFHINNGEQEYAFGQKGLNGDFQVLAKELFKRKDFGITKGFLKRIWDIPEYQVEDFIAELDDDALATLYLYAMQYGYAIWVDGIIHAFRLRSGISLPPFDPGLSEKDRYDLFRPLIELTRDPGHRITMFALQKMLPWQGRIEEIYENRQESELILFDLDKTLNHAQNYYRVVKQMSRQIIAAEAGVDIGVIEERVQQLRRELGVLGYPLRGHDVPEAFGIDPKEHDLEIARVVNADYYIARNPELIKALENLKARGKKLAVLTDSGPVQAGAILHALGIRDLFDGIYASGDVGFRKPDQRLWMSVLKEFGVSPEKAVMVGDNQAMDLEPAWALGMRAIKISREKDIIQVEHLLSGIEQKSVSVDHAQAWEDFILGGLQHNPPWKDSDIYKEFSSNTLLGTTQATDMAIDLFLEVLERFDIQVPARGRGLALGIGHVTRELLLLKRSFDLDVVHGVEWNDVRIKSVAQELSILGLSPQEFILHHADMNDLKGHIPDGSIDLIYGAGLAINLGDDGRELKASLAEDMVRMLSEHGVALIFSEGASLIPVFKEYGKVVKFADFIIFQKGTDADSAQDVQKGGIDLNSVVMDLQIQAADRGMVFDIDPAELKSLETLSGLRPVIVGVHPLDGLRRFLGVH